MKVKGKNPTHQRKMENEKFEKREKRLAEERAKFQQKVKEEVEEGKQKTLCFFV